MPCVGNGMDSRGDSLFTRVNTRLGWGVPTTAPEVEVTTTHVSEYPFGNDHKGMYAEEKVTTTHVSEYPFGTDFLLS